MAAFNNWLGQFCYIVCASGLHLKQMYVYHNAFFHSARPTDIEQKI